MERDIKRQFIGNNDGEPEYPELYQRWQNAMKISVVGKNGLVECMNSLSFTVATKLVESLKSCLDPYMPYYFAMELIDPTASRGIPLPTTWIAVDDICKKHDLNYTQVRSEILEMRDDSEDLSQADVSLCKSNLLQFYQMNLHTLPDNQRKLSLEAYAQVIFQLTIETVLIESLFSIMNYNKDKKRSRLNDATVASIIHTRDIKNSIDNVYECFSQDDVALDTDRVSLHKLLW